MQVPLTQLLEGQSSPEQSTVEEETPVANTALSETLAALQNLRERKISALSTLIQRVEEREDRVDQKIHFWLDEVKKWQQGLQ